MKGMSLSELDCIGTRAHDPEFSRRRGLGVWFGPACENRDKHQKGEQQDTE